MADKGRLGDVWSQGRQTADSWRWRWRAANSAPADWPGGDGRRVQTRKSSRANGRRRRRRRSSSAAQPRRLCCLSNSGHNEGNSWRPFLPVMQFAVVSARPVLPGIFPSPSLARHFLVTFLSLFSDSLHHHRHQFLPGTFYLGSCLLASLLTVVPPPSLSDARHAYLTSLVHDCTLDFLMPSSFTLAFSFIAFLVVKRVRSCYPP